MTDNSKLTFFRGRVGLSAILKALGIGKGDQVAIQAFTCLAVPEGVFAASATPRFVDIEKEGYNMDPSSLAKAITPATRAIVVQHTFGIPANIDQIREIANQNKIHLIEDCCHSFRSTLDGQKVGEFGIASFHSYEWGKPIIVGIGGSVQSKDSELLKSIEADYKNYRVPSLTTQVKIELQYAVHSMTYRPSTFWILKKLFHRLSHLGIAKGSFNPIPQNGKTADDFQLRMPPRLHKRLRRQINAIDKHAEHSRRLVEQYQGRIRSAGILHPEPPELSETVYVRYPIRVAEKETVLRHARKMNIELADWYRTPVHPLTAEQSGEVGYKPGSCPNAEQRAKEIVSLPTHLRVRQRYVDRVIDFLNNFEPSHQLALPTAN